MAITTSLLMSRLAIFTKLKTWATPMPWPSFGQTRSTKPQTPTPTANEKRPGLLEPGLFFDDVVVTLDDLDNLAGHVNVFVVAVEFVFVIVVMVHADG